MKIAILGYGKEGQCAKKWLSEEYPKAELSIFDHFKIDDLASFRLNDFDLVVRTPSVSPYKISEVAPNVKITSVTKLFFERCPCRVVGVTGTKGKGTTASMIRDLLEKIGQKTWLVGNIGTPALDVLDKIHKNDVVIYELSSFQLWDLEQSPHIAVILRIEPDHLNVHNDYTDYVAAKTNIVKWQNSRDFCIYYSKNTDSERIAMESQGKKLAYPIANPKIVALVNELQIVGGHNKENAEAAILATAASADIDLDTLLDKYSSEIAAALRDFKGLPHRLEFVREKNGVKYYDDSFSSAFPAMSVAIDTFKDQPTIIIAGGLDRDLDLTAAKQKLFHSGNVKKAILIGQTKEKLAEHEEKTKFILTDSLVAAVKTAQKEAQKYPNSVVLLSPGAASFDMFQNFEERGTKFQAIVRDL